MVWTFEEEMCRCPSEGRCERLDIVDMRRGRGRLKKYYKEITRQDMTHLYINKDMSLDRRIYKSEIRIEEY